MTISWEESQQCPCCKEEPATVTLATELGATRVGTRCAGIVEALGQLCGLDPQRQPARLTLRVVK